MNLTALLAHIHPVFEDFTALEWTVTVIASVSTLWSLVMAVRYTLRPGEEDPDHLKRIILDGPPAGGTQIDVRTEATASSKARKGPRGEG